MCSRLERNGKSMKMRTVFAVMMLAAALLAVTALGIFVATIAEKDHAPHRIIGEASGSPLFDVANQANQAI